MVSGIDRAMARFLKVLDEKGLAENTIIVYSADNGYHMGNRGFAGQVVSLRGSTTRAHDRHGPTCGRNTNAAKSCPNQP